MCAEVGFRCIPHNKQYCRSDHEYKESYHQEKSEIGVSKVDTDESYCNNWRGFFVCQLIQKSSNKIPLRFYLRAYYLMLKFHY